MGKAHMSDGTFSDAVAYLRNSIEDVKEVPKPQNMTYHYENTPIQIIENFTTKKGKFFRYKILIFFIFLL